MLKYRIIEGKNLKKDNIIKNKTAFTLAEVLITLGIIGVVAAMTLPALITKHQQQVTVSALKKNYSILSNAVSQAKSIYGDDLFSWPAFPDYYNNQKSINHKELLNILKNSGVNIIDITDKHQPQYTVVSFCGVEKYKKTNGEDYGTGAGGSTIAWGMLPDSACWAVNGIKYPNTSEYALDTFFIDINGAKRPNKLGRDLFVFSLKRNGQVIPYESSRATWAHCSNYWQASGFACAEKIMQDGWQVKDDYPW